jgi:hypothetical protein
LPYIFTAWYLIKYRDVTYYLTFLSQRPSFWNGVFSSYFRILETGQTPYTQWFWVLYTIIITLWILKAHNVLGLLCSGSDSMWHATYRFRNNPFSL